MFARAVVIQNAAGFHVRPAQLFVEKAGEFGAQITVKTETGAEVDSKSILGLMALGLEKGTKITIEANGADAEDAVNALAALVESKFGEE